ncbi:MAG TPA: SPFH domain-containing protein [Steroidobacteraceae bacterium]|nr:SPFH domain-containing protein [Steroidobacteraceae bacterium]
MFTDDEPANNGSASGPEGERSDDERRGGGDHGARALLRTGVATLILAAAIAAACIVMVPAGQADVITRFGNPVRVITQPGLAWKLPAPFESAIPVDLRLRTTSTGLQDVGLRDGIRVLVQAYAAWQVPDDPQQLLQFLRSVRNQPDEAALQLRSFMNASLHITSSNFALADVVNIDPGKVRLDNFEQQVRDQVAQRMLQVYGIQVRQVGIERMTLPDETLAATVARMIADRETVAAQVTALGLQKAAGIRADADRDARETVAQAREQASSIQANAEQAAANIYADAYKRDPSLYTTLRSLDTIGQLVGRNTSLILRTDAAPFRVLVDGPGAPGSIQSAAAQAGAAVGHANRAGSAAGDARAARPAAGSTGGSRAQLASRARPQP